MGIFREGALDDGKGVEGMVECFACVACVS
jgi:hypothetical protein